MKTIGKDGILLRLAKDMYPERDDLSSIEVKTLFNDMEYIGWCIDEYQFYLKRATIELANYLSKYNRIKKDIQKDIILEFGI